jgi:hypothetical protein
MLLAGAPLAAEKRGATPRANCERRAFPAGRRDGQLDGPNAPGWAAREERAATSVRRAGGEATVWALDSAANVQICYLHGSSAQTVALAAARFAGRGPFLTLRRCEGERDTYNESRPSMVALAIAAAVSLVISHVTRIRLTCSL